MVTESSTAEYNNVGQMRSKAITHHTIPHAQKSAFSDLQRVAEYRLVESKLN